MKRHPGCHQSCHHLKIGVNPSDLLRNLSSLYNRGGVLWGGGYIHLWIRLSNHTLKCYLEVVTKLVTGEKGRTAGEGEGTNFRPSTCRCTFFGILNKPLLSVITTDNQWTRRITARLFTSKNRANLVVLQDVSYIRRGHPIGFSHIPFTLSPRPIAGSPLIRARWTGPCTRSTGVGGCRISMGKKINKIKGVPGVGDTRANRRTLYASGPSPVFSIGSRTFRFALRPPRYRRCPDACR